MPRDEDPPKSLATGIVLSASSEKWLRELSKELHLGIGHIVGLFIEHAHHNRVALWDSLHGHIVISRGVTRQIFLKGADVRHLHLPVEQRPKLALVQAVSPEEAEDEVPEPEQVPELVHEPGRVPAPVQVPKTPVVEFPESADSKMVAREGWALILDWAAEDHETLLSQLLHSLRNPGSFLDEEIPQPFLTSPEEITRWEEALAERERIYESWKETILISQERLRNLQGLIDPETTSKRRRRICGEIQDLELDLRMFLAKIRASQRKNFQECLTFDSKIN